MDQLNDDESSPKSAERLRDENLAAVLLTTERNLAKHRFAIVRIDEDHQPAFERCCQQLGWSLTKLKTAWAVEI